MRSRLLPVLFATAALAPPVWAQPAAPAPASQDVIGALLDQHGQAPGDEDEPDTASAPRTAPEPEPTLVPQPGAAPYTPLPRPHLDAPVQLEETGKTADAPPTPRASAPRLLRRRGSRARWTAAGC